MVIDKERFNELLNSSAFSIFVDVFLIARKYPYKFAVIVLFHIWCYSMAMRNISEFKSWVELIPF